MTARSSRLATFVRIFESSDARASNFLRHDSSLDSSASSFSVELERSTNSRRQASRFSITMSSVPPYFFLSRSRRASRDSTSSSFPGETSIFAA